ncbi:2Fe-2S ferredoxin-type domain-containing protein [Hyaloraphidium curvatum]|nr:2Fe-2S ferredoxin-type domain-containing protein [Hyaloraphidium curvatum]
MHRAVRAFSAPAARLSALSDARCALSAAAMARPAPAARPVALPRPRASAPSLPPSAPHGRPFHSSSALLHTKKHKPGDGYRVTFVTPEGEELECWAGEDETMLDVAHANDVEMEGACEGSCACSTCHVIVDKEYFDMLEEPTDEENDMLDLAFGLTETSRLGCQIKMTKELEGMVMQLPSATRNMAVDG